MLLLYELFSIVAFVYETITVETIVALCHMFVVVVRIVKKILVLFNFIKKVLCPQVLRKVCFEDFENIFKKM